LDERNGILSVKHKNKTNKKQKLASAPVIIKGDYWLTQVHPENDW